ncbi:bifunctional hydroxymethylpyrimidine kinase/phosphomethylpyrimidine kinase (plasmid) [Photobacterium sp. GJ3]|uniref:bifunctional hydroxymethylpyrimidine kinase/phosphomethylpyrimidine kinase n=1 Tax=Photobacterium sp. GJ3 TaxID=2829502 RepID=UPI001B8AE76C|nr:bifunctional hydroxymethylpyrimidine kinase/phosphomethylpyrimidine kinase [Photobacterium sp. GJ3]QUJ70306.1 bifunctional hydroxymethylpyrimidine kinase/phosphomethylpyrimidine kinase [Photobacterium sp. GJ3]
MNKPAQTQHASNRNTTPIVLTIAGSDSGGGAGIQADIKAISATGGYACSVITALTAQNTLGVTDIFPVSPDFVEAQLDAVFSDLNVKAVKIGMLSDAGVIEAVARKLRQYRPEHIVLDPVMVATSGDLLLETKAITTLKAELLPLATLITPNLPEAIALTRSDNHAAPVPSVDSSDKETIIAQLQSLDTEAVLLKGGHWETESQSTDYLLTKGDIVTFSTQRIQTKNTHGTGCTLSAAIASYLAQGYTRTGAVAEAKNYLTLALKFADQLKIGQGHGPVHHFHAFQTQSGDLA